jgi:dihydropteroate synthase
VGPEEEWRRLEPVLKEFRKEFPMLRLSVDTYWSDVVRRTYDLVGDFIVNDISAGEDDSGMLPAVAELGLVYVAMHKKGGPADMQSKAVYDNVTEEVTEYFNSFSLKASEAGIKEWILDPGFGFAKTIEQNYQLLNEMSRLKSVAGPGGRPPRILAGLSRKSMAYRFLGIGPEDSLPATQVLHVAALRNGADILRVHDVAEALRTVTLYRALDL